MARLLPLCSVPNQASLLARSLAAALEGRETEDQRHEFRVCEGQLGHMTIAVHEPPARCGAGSFHNQREEQFQRFQVASNRAWMTRHVLGQALRQLLKRGTLRPFHVA